MPSFLSSSAKALLALTAAFVTLGVLVLLFPRVLALVVAIICFIAALTCLRFAWKIFRAGRLASHPRRQVDVNIYDPDDYPPSQQPG